MKIEKSNYFRWDNMDRAMLRAQFWKAVQKLQEIYGFVFINEHFAKCFISVIECLIREAKTRQYSYF